MNLFETKVRYQKIDENGKERKVTEAYLLDAMSFTETESRMIEEMEPFIGDIFSLEAIKRSNITEIYQNEDGDRFYKCKVVFVTLDEEKGKEKKVPNYMLVQANDTQNANDNLLKGLEGIIVDYEIKSIVETNIVDVFPYYPESASKEEEIESIPDKVNQ